MKNTLLNFFPHLNSKIQLIFFAAFLFSTTLVAQTKHITIYLEGCSHCENLIENTYTDKEVATKLNEFERSMYEYESNEGLLFARTLEINSAPAQIFIRDKDTILITGYLDKENELKLLADPFLFHAELNKASPN